MHLKDPVEPARVEAIANHFPEEFVGIYQGSYTLEK